MIERAVELLDSLRFWLNYREDETTHPILSLAVVDKDRIRSLDEELGYLTTILKDSERKWNEHAEMKDVVTQILDLGLLAVEINIWNRNFPTPYHVGLDYVLKEMQSIKKLVVEIYDKKLYGTGGVVPQLQVSSHGSSSGAHPATNEETVVGFEKETEKIKDQLAGGRVKQLQVISIVGMAGSGKTTLARKLYNDPFIVYHFYIRAWTYVSQEYRERDLLLGILTSINVVREEMIYTMTDEKLREELYRRLKCKRYLIVMDDVWHVKFWNDFKFLFPDDNNGSRIMLTTRHRDVASQAQPDNPPHFMRFLTEDESWDLLQEKVFWEETCPPNLVEIGKQIAKKCQGLPLVIVVVAGLLAKTDKTQDWWNQVAESVNSYVASDPKQCLDTLALSYNHLPDHLTSCFLYFGAFPEDFEIPVHKLICLWIAEGFIHQIGQKSLEDVAEEYLMDLIDRSLVLVAKKSSTGGVRACRIHDLLRDLCLKKAEEENFLQEIYGYEQVFNFWSSSTVNNKPHRMSIHSRVLSCAYTADIRSCLCHASDQRPLGFLISNRIFCDFKFLRVLDFSSIEILYLPPSLDLVHLRYLALQIVAKISLNPIFELWSLETLIVSKGGGLPLSLDIPLTIWMMVKLRHIHTRGKIYIHMPGEINIQALTNDLDPSVLDNLQTMSLVWPSRNLENALVRTPNLKKLGFCGPLVSKLEGYLTFPELDFLNHLETLKLSNTTNPYGHPIIGECRPSIFQWVKFPPNLKKLTLENTYLAWKEMSLLGMLPNLEVLKLRHDACIGPQWETSDGQFLRLKVLKLDDLHVVQWNTSSFHFPNLQHLVLFMCQKLGEIPSSLGDIPTLQIVELWWCSYSAVHSARQIQEEQHDMGNDSLKIIINRLDEEDLTTY
uniref:Uncharacterized protein n=1 Tax=Davidia involucrata TaxID=16924 RepID=A0A5B6YL23_DAVIN